jgi:glyoxylase-like metal-dependent hydrolase (beta-lactamase superfamily II)
MPGMGIRSNVGSMGVAGVTLIRDDVNVLVDTGHFGTRTWLKEELSKRRISPREIDVVVLTHLHWDHCLNFDLFERAEVVLGEKELKEGFLVEGNEQFDRAFKALLANRDVKAVNDGDAVSKHARILLTPGHSPGHIAVVVKGERGKLRIFSGDAIPNYRAYLRGFPDFSYYNKRLARESVRKIKELNPEIIYPGHDSPFNDKGYVERDDFTLILRRENEENSLVTFSHVPADKPVIMK